MQDAQTQQPADKTSQTSIAISQDLLSAGQLALDRYNVERQEKGEKRIRQREFFELVFSRGLGTFAT